MGKLFDTLRENIGMIVLLAIVVAILVIWQMNITDPGSTVSGIWVSILNTILLPIQSALVNIQPGLDYLAVLLFGAFLVWGLPRVWSGKAKVTQTVHKTADKIKPPITPPATPSIPENPGNPEPSPPKSEEIIQQIKEEKSA